MMIYLYHIIGKRGTNGTEIISPEKKDVWSAHPNLSVIKKHWFPLETTVRTDCSIVTVICSSWKIILPSMFDKSPTKQKHDMIAK